MEKEARRWSGHTRHLLAAAILALGWPAVGIAQTITEYAVPTANSGLSGITVGPDGALWFTEGTGNKIGRITTAGVVTNEFSVPTAVSQPFAIALGPDGALWFIAIDIGRITRPATWLPSSPFRST